MSKFNLKSIKEEFKAKGIFYTTNELALLIKSFVDIEVDEVYDPTCGDGSLLSVFDDNVKTTEVYCHVSTAMLSKLNLPV